MIILEEQAGLNAGLNKGLKIGRMLKKNVRLKNVSIKNAIKVGKVAIPLATTAMSFIPGGGVASKILDSKVGKLITKVKNGKVVKFATKIANSKVGKFAMDNVVKPTIKNAISGGGSQSYSEAEQAPMMENATPTPMQLETISQIKGVPSETLEAGQSLPNDSQLDTISQMKDIPLENLKQEVASQKELAVSESNTTTDKPNYTLPIVIGVGVVGAVLLATSSKSN
jgi:hypothetical protein